MRNSIIITASYTFIYFCIFYLIDKYTDINEFILFGYVLGISLLFSFTTYKAIRTKYFLKQIRLIALIVAFMFLLAFSIINYVYRWIFKKELDFLFIPIHWTLTKLNNKIDG